MLKNLKSDEHKVRHVIYGVRYSQYNVCQVHSWKIFAEYLLIYTLWVSQFWTIGSKLKQSQKDKRLEVFFFTENYAKSNQNTWDQRINKVMSDVYGFSDVTFPCYISTCIIIYRITLFNNMLLLFLVYSIMMDFSIHCFRPHSWQW